MPLYSPRRLPMIIYWERRFATHGETEFRQYYEQNIKRSVWSLTDLFSGECTWESMTPLLTETLNHVNCYRIFRKFCANHLPWNTTSHTILTNRAAQRKFSCQQITPNQVETTNQRVTIAAFGNSPRHPYPSSAHVLSRNFF